ncbi:Rrf2 family transcriptional regulator [Psychromonas antarctica]|uniref:Rrf2 family transcriptional regulator n=1 Tax=Psychromonas antarctica TaxID=67573 RepID=UPI001EE888B6|nr:Rrf2 family transcriptional regulator [Psychromonas antarctica]MCG6202106.1 Rrf2 family transcriptional regulator [Psychromonas antarctica]
MRLTTFTDLGLRTLMYLAQLPAGQLSSVAEVSKVYNISQNHMVKIAGKLKKHGYLTAIRGKNGGICLAQPQADINIGQVIRDMENHLDAVDCKTSSCQLMANCELKKALSNAMDAFLNVMDDYSLTDLVTNKQQIIQVRED